MRPVSERASPASLLVSVFGCPGAECRASASRLRASELDVFGLHGSSPVFRWISHLEKCPGSDRGGRCIDERLCGEFLLRFERRVFARRGPSRRRVNFSATSPGDGCSERLIFGCSGDGLPAPAAAACRSLRGRRSLGTASARTFPSNERRGFGERAPWPGAAAESGQEDITGSRMRCFLRLSAPRPKSTAEKVARCPRCNTRATVDEHFGGPPGPSSQPARAAGGTGHDRRHERRRRC
jgi:hypothetical protein